MVEYLGGSLLLSIFNILLIYLNHGILGTKLYGIMRINIMNTRE